MREYKSLARLVHLTIYPCVSRHCLGLRLFALLASVNYFAFRLAVLSGALAGLLITKLFSI